MTGTPTNGNGWSSRLSASTSIVMVVFAISGAIGGLAYTTLRGSLDRAERDIENRITRPEYAQLTASLAILQAELGRRINRDQHEDLRRDVARIELTLEKKTERGDTIQYRERVDGNLRRIDAVLLRMDGEIVRRPEHATEDALRKSALDDLRQRLEDMKRELGSAHTLADAIKEQNDRIRRLEDFGRGRPGAEAVK